MANAPPALFPGWEWPCWYWVGIETWSEAQRLAAEVASLRGQLAGVTAERDAALEQSLATEVASLREQLARVSAERTRAQGAERAALDALAAAAAEATSRA